MSHEDRSDLDTTLVSLCAWMRFKVYVGSTWWDLPQTKNVTTTTKDAENPLKWAITCDKAHRLTTEAYRHRRLDMSRILVLTYNGQEFPPRCRWVLHLTVFQAVIDSLVCCILRKIGLVERDAIVPFRTWVKDQFPVNTMGPRWLASYCNWPIS